MKKIKGIWYCGIVFCIIGVLGCGGREDALKEFDFSIQESPVDRGQYTLQTDIVYKEAFFKAVTNRIPIYDSNQGETFYYEDLLQSGKEMDENGIPKYVGLSDYYYQDYDGDALPELVINTEGPCVLKYHPQEDKVELYYRKGQGWNLLGAGQMIYEGYYDNFSEIRSDGDEESRDTVRWEYACETAGRKVAFYHIMTSDTDPDGFRFWADTYKISADGVTESEVDEKTWDEWMDGYFLLKSQAPHPMSFSNLFGEDKGVGYLPGSEPWPRYLLENTDALPMNEETGKEWEAYKDILEGDFSLLESELQWSLQDKYEESLNNGDGRCDWSYFLMDFSRDGRKELVIRFNRKQYNDTAFFRYEDGQIKMWGSYDSADSHGFETPLINGRMLSVVWQQNDKVMCLMRVDEKGDYTQERCYSREEDPETGEYSYGFQDYYCDGQPCGTREELAEEVWLGIENKIESMYIPEDAWRPCSRFEPKADGGKSERI